MSVVVLLFLSLFVRHSVAVNKVSHSDCVVTPWFDFSENCKTGYTVQLRYVLKHSVGSGRQCPSLISIKPCDTTQSTNDIQSVDSVPKKNDYLGYYEIHQDYGRYGASVRNEYTGYYGGYGDTYNVGYYHTGNYKDYGTYGY